MNRRADLAQARLDSAILSLISGGELDGIITFRPFPPLAQNQMPQVKTENTIGNFSMTAEAEVSAEVYATLANLGFKYVIQRQSEVDRVLGGFEKKGEKQVRKANWKRNDVPFSADLAAKLEPIFAKMEISDGVTVEAIVSVGENVRDTVESKFTVEKEAIAAHREKGDLDVWVKSVLGFKGDTPFDETNSELLLAVRARKLALLRSLND